MLRDPHKFWALGQEGQRAAWAYEHVTSYFDGSLVQYGRVVELWRQSSAVPEASEGSWEAKLKLMHQVVRDIHFLLVSKQAIWRTLSTLSSQDLYPSFQSVVPLKVQWAPYFEQYREPRNSFEHFEDQILGNDSRSNSPGFGVRLLPDGSFSLGVQQPVVLGEASKRQLVEFYAAFEQTLLAVVDGVA